MLPRTPFYVNRVLILIFLFALLHLEGMTAASANEVVLKSGLNVINMTLASGDNVRLEMELRPYRTGLLGRPFARDSWWGAWDGDAPLPDKIIWSMKLSVNGNAAAFPQSAFDYLTKLHHLDLREDHGVIIAILSGGDAGESYNVEWRFTYSKVLAHYVIRRRTIHHGEFPEVHEDTDYTYNEGKDL